MKKINPILTMLDKENNRLEKQLAKSKKEIEAKKRLEYLREELNEERISYGELAELESLVEYIDKSDTQLLEAAGVPEQTDLFETPHLIPKNVMEVLNTHNDNADQYKELARLVNELKTIGYTFDYYLDAEPYDLRKI